MSSFSDIQVEPVLSHDVVIRLKADNVNLAGRLWLPAVEHGERLTTILEATPYRLRDVSAVRESENHGYFAAHGYACLRIDMRGTGDSTGFARPMLSRQERQDTLAALDWVVGQPWSNGRVVLFGISWGAINAMLAAAERPHAIHGVVAIAFYNDAFRHGLGLKGGCLTNEAVGWSAAVLGYQTRPPDPIAHPDDWAAQWERRVDVASLELEHVLRHPGRDEYWDERRIDGLADIACPVLILSGLSDGNFTSAVPAAVEALGSRVTAVIGPWGHRWPHLAIPGPGIDALPLIRGWLDEHVDGTAGASALALGSTAVWVEEGRPALTYYPTARGRWAHASRPPFGAGRYRRFLSERGLSRLSGSRATATLLPSGVAGGLAAGEVMPAFNAGPGAELPGDQRWDDARSLVFDSPSLPRALVVMGTPVAYLRLRCDRPVAHLCVRLCEVTAAGQSVRISLGAKNLCLLNERDPSHLEPGRSYHVTVPLDFCAYRFAGGHKIRLAISTSYWPLLWPSPQPVRLEVDLGESFIDLPRAELDSSSQVDALAVTPRPLPSTIGRVDLRSTSRLRRITHDPFTSGFSLQIEDDNGCFKLEDSGIEVGSHMSERYEVDDRDSLSATAAVRWSWQLGRAGWSTRVETETSLSGSSTSFEIRAQVKAYKGASETISRNWTLSIPRRFV